MWGCVLEGGGACHGSVVKVGVAVVAEEQRSQRGRGVDGQRQMSRWKDVEEEAVGSWGWGLQAERV